MKYFPAVGECQDLVMKNMNITSSDAPKQKERRFCENLKMMNYSFNLRWIPPGDAVQHYLDEIHLKRKLNCWLPEQWLWWLMMKSVSPWAVKPSEFMYQHTDYNNPGAADKILHDDDDDGVDVVDWVMIIWDIARMNDTRWWRIYQASVTRTLPNLVLQTVLFRVQDTTDDDDQMTSYLYQTCDILTPRLVRFRQELAR